jgi:hypothetical protein
MSRVLWVDDSPATVRGCPVLVHRAAALLRAFFGPHLTMTPLRFANPSPPSGWIEDFPLQAVVRSYSTHKESPGRAGAFKESNEGI